MKFFVQIGGGLNPRGLPNALGLLELAVLERDSDIGGVVVEGEALQVWEVARVEGIASDRNDVLLGDCGEREDLLTLDRGKEALTEVVHRDDCR